jgi:hypothetical protein
MGDALVAKVLVSLVVIGCWWKFAGAALLAPPSDDERWSVGACVWVVGLTACMVVAVYLAVTEIHWAPATAGMGTP